MTDKTLFILILVGLVIMLVLVVAVVLIFSTSKQRILKEVSVQQKKDIEHKAQMLRNIVETQEKERSRIARELHDEIGTKLNVVNLNLNLLETTIGNNLSPKAITDQIQTSVKESIVRVRELSHGLYPPVLEKFGLQKAFDALSIEVNKTGQINLDLDIDHDWGYLDLNQELNIYRIFQELINNTIKHAGASLIKITSKIDNEHLIISYLDDGKGFKNSDELPSGMGMLNIDTRAALLGATTQFANRKPSGISFKMSLPFIKHQ